MTAYEMAEILRNTADMNDTMVTLFFQVLEVAENYNHIEDHEDLLRRIFDKAMNPCPNDPSLQE